MPEVVQKVPFADLHAQYRTIKKEIDAAIRDVIASSAFIRGPEVVQFETAFANAIGTQHCVSCANGTDAIYIALKALELKPGDEVIVPAMSWISTSETVSQAGGRVVFCDIDPISHTLDPEKLSEAITSHTVGVIPVHLYGHPAKMDRIKSIAETHGLWVLEDCAQAHLAQFQNQTVGTFGTVSTFSFYPGKNLGAMGDAGGIVTNDALLAERMAMFARHGGLKKHDHQIEGINSRLDGLQAAILNVKLAHLETWTKQRRELAARYNQMITNNETVLLPVETEHARHVWHVYQICSENRSELAKYLNGLGIQTGINYPSALPFLPCYADHRHDPEDFPNAHKLSKQTLSIPIFPEMTKLQQDHVINAINDWGVSD